MSEEKLYAVKNDKGEWLSFDNTQTGIWYSNNPTLFKDKRYAEAQSMGRKAHVVTLVDELPTAEPVKPVLPKKVADELEVTKKLNFSFDSYIARVIVYDQHGYTNSHAFWMNNGDGVIKTLMDAWNNGYTVETEKKYNVKVPHTKDGWYYISWNSDLRTVTGKEICSDFTESDIERYGLQDCEREEVK